MPVQLTSQILGEIEFNGGVVRLQFLRMTIDQFAAYSAEWSAWSERRKAEGGPSDVADVLTRARAPKTDAERAELEAHMTWLKDTFTAYVSVVDGELVLDGTSITTGAALFGVIANYINLVPRVLSELYYAQRLTEDQKKALKLVRGFVNSSAPNSADAAAAETETDRTTADSSGASSAPTAAPAALEASTASASASRPLDASVPLGTMDDSCSIDVLSDSSAALASGC